MVLTVIEFWQKDAFVAHSKSSSVKFNITFNNSKVATSKIYNIPLTQSMEWYCTSAEVKAGQLKSIGKRAIIE